MIEQEPLGEILFNWKANTNLKYQVWLIVYCIVQDPISYYMIKYEVIHFVRHLIQKFIYPKHKKNYVDVNAIKPSK